MRLETDSEQPVDSPTPDYVKQVLTTLIDHPKRTFVVLEDKPGFFMQVAFDDHLNFELEYQDGTTAQHYETYVIEDVDEVVWAFLSYLRGDDKWRQGFNWKKLDL